MASYRISEIYRAIQGEGWHSGLPCTLVRLQGCNLRCEFCDTPYAQDPEGGKNAMLGQLVRSIEEIHRKGDIVLITGGEPALQYLIPLAQALKDLGPVHLETNGTQHVEALAVRLDWITVSPKPPTPCDQSSLLMADEIKWLVSQPDNTDIDALKDFLRQPVLQYGKPKKICLQPVSQDPQATKRAYWACLANGWRLSLQIHKLIGVK